MRGYEFMGIGGQAVPAMEICTSCLPTLRLTVCLPSCSSGHEYCALEDVMLGTGSDRGGEGHGAEGVVMEVSERAEKSNGRVNAIFVSLSSESAV